VLVVAAIALLLSDNERPAVQPFKQLLPIAMADTRLTEPQGPVPVRAVGVVLGPRAERAVEGSRPLTSVAVAPEAAPEERVSLERTVGDVERPEASVDEFGGGAGVLLIGRVAVHGD
jgi:hypothetical protein